MLDESTRHGIGGNNPPNPIDDLKSRVNEFANTAKAWSDNGVRNQSESEDIDAFARQVRDLKKEVDAARVEMKRPHDDAAASIQAAYKPLLDLCDRMNREAKALRTTYLQEMERQEQERRRREMEQAAEAEAKAQDAARAAEDQGDFVGAAEAREKQEQAAEQIEKVEKAPAPTAGTGMRTIRTAVVENHALALGHYRNHPDVVALVKRLTQADLRRMGEEFNVPGVRVETERKL